MISVPTSAPSWATAAAGTFLLHGLLLWALLAHPFAARLAAPRLESFEMVDLPVPKIEAPPAPIVAPTPAPPPPRDTEPPTPRLKPAPRLKPLAATPVPTVPAPAAAPETTEAPPAAPAAPVVAEPYVPPRGHTGYRDNPPPVYPPAARRMGREGLVVLLVEVAADGRPAAIRVLRGSGSDLLDQAALRAVERWRFAPATRGGRPVEASAEIPIRFQLTER